MKSNKGLTLVEIVIGIVIILTLISVFAGGCSSLFFMSTHDGKVTENVQLGTGQTSIFASQDAKTIAFSRAVSIEESNGTILTFSSEDRQFAVVKVGDYIKIRICQYAPWNFVKAGTYYNGRLLQRRKSTN